jgi:hypothetical protein
MSNKTNEIILSLQKAFEKSSSILNSTADKNILRHILFSLSNRIQIINHNYKFLNDNGYFEMMDQIDDNVIPILNTHLNSIYIHISGGLDNLTWAFCYKSKIFGEIDENNFECRRKVGLRSKQFKTAIGKNENMSSFLNENEIWLDELKEFRDPIAHREILLISRIYSPEEARKKDELENIIKQLSEEATFKVVNGKMCEKEIKAFELHVEKIQNQIDHLGKYHPVFCTTPEPKALLSVREQIEKDISNFLKFVNKIMDEILIKI